MEPKEATQIGEDVIISSVSEIGINNREIEHSKGSRFSYVTNTDEKLDSRIREGLNRTEYPVLTEESDNDTNKDNYWIVDPIDGTIPFAYGLPNYVSMLAFVSNGRPIASVLYSPETGDMYKATSDFTTRNDNSIQSSDSQTIHENAVFCSIRSDGKHRDERYRDLHSRMTRNSIVFGVYSAGYGSVRIATGDAVAAVYTDLNEWDYMPTSLLVESSGGVVGSLVDGETGIDSLIDQDGKFSCFASTEQAFNEVLEIYNDNL